MEYRQLGHLKEKSSLFGLGCMRFNGTGANGAVVDEEKAISLIRRAIDGGVTYIDTAYVYLDKTSESILGKALRDGYREKVTIATKMPLWCINNHDDMLPLLESELQKLQTDHIDFYLMHGIDKAGWLKFKELKGDEFFTEMKRAGKIRYKCFSFHGSYEDFEYIINDYDWDMVQIQYNFMDINNQAGTRGLKLAGKLGIPVVIMEGLLGGKLANAPANVQKLYDEFPVKRSAVDWAFRWLGNNPEILTILSGCNEPEQIDENLRIFDDLKPNSMTEDELKLMDNVRAAYIARTKIGCTGCAYCMPCPAGVDIPRVFRAWNASSLYNVKNSDNWDLLEIKRKNQTPVNCRECGKCMRACPQKLDIIPKLKEAWKELKD